MFSEWGDGSKQVCKILKLYVDGLKIFQVKNLKILFKHFHVQRGCRRQDEYNNPPYSSNSQAKNEGFSLADKYY